MREILRDLSPAALVNAIEENMLALIEAFRRWPRAEVHDESDVKWSMTDIPFPMFNGIMAAQLAPERVDPFVQTITAEARARNVPLLWSTGPGTRPADLGAHLERHGFAGDDPVPGMAIDLARLSEPPPAPAGLTVQLVEDDESLRQWNDVSAIGFGMPEFVVEHFVDFMQHLDAGSVRAYLGRLDGRPVATALMAFGAGVAGIYNVATISDVRRQGIGAHITAVALRDARALGYQAAILHASKMGAGVYRALGFREYCKIRRYLWVPGPQREAG